MATQIRFRKLAFSALMTDARLEEAITLAIPKTVDLEPNLFRKRLFIFMSGRFVALAALCAVAIAFTDSPSVLLAIVAALGVCVCLFLIGWRKYSSATGKKSFSEFIYFLYDKTLLPLGLMKNTT